MLDYQRVVDMETDETENHSWYTTQIVWQFAPLKRYQGGPLFVVVFDL